MDMTVGRAGRIVIKNAGWDDGLTAAAGQVGEGRAAVSAEGGGEAACGRQIVVGDAFLSDKPSQGVCLDGGVGGTGGAGGFPAAGAMAVDEALEGHRHFEADTTAEAATLDGHDARRWPSSDLR